jgi:hypothetical protein
MEGSVEEILKERGQVDTACSHVAQDRHACRALVNTAMDFRVPLNAENFLHS